jgi:type II secretory pathway component PulF
VAVLNSLYPIWLLLLMTVGPMPVLSYVMQSRLGILLSDFFSYETYNTLHQIIGLACATYPVLLATVVFLLILALWRPLHSVARLLLPPLGRGIDIILWRTPLLGRFVRRRAAASYALAASRLLEGGIPQVEALSLAATASGSHIFARPAMRAAERCGEGQPLHDALTAEFPKGWLPSDFLWYVRTGERSGQLPQALDQAAEMCFVRAQTLLSRMVGLIFPVGVVLAGVNVGIMAYLMMGAISNMIMGYEL